MSIDPEQAETIYKLLGAMRGPMERTHEIVERGFREVVGALGAVLATHPACVTCGKPATFRTGQEPSCADHAVADSVRMPNADAIDQAFRVLRTWRPKKERKKSPGGVVGRATAKAEGLLDGARCAECGMVLTLHGLGGEIASVECGRDHEVTLRDGRTATLDQNGIPTQLPPPLEATERVALPHRPQQLDPQSVPTVPRMRRAELPPR